MNDNESKVKLNAIKNNRIETFMGLKLSQPLDLRLVKWMAVTAAEILLLVISVPTVISPRYTQIQKVKAENKRETQVLTSLRERDTILDDLYSTFLNKDLMFAQAIPVAKDLGLMLGSLRYDSNQTRVNIIEYTINPGEILNSKAKAGVIPPALPIDLTVTGKLNNMQEFLDRLDSSYPVKKVESIEVANNPDSASDDITLKMTISFYYLQFSGEAIKKMPFTPLTDNDVEFLSKLETFYSIPAQKTDLEGVELGNQDLFGAITEE